MGVVSGELLLLSREADMKHTYPNLSPWQTWLINHCTERLSDLAKVTQLINERSQLLNLGILDSALDRSKHILEFRKLLRMLVNQLGRDGLFKRECCNNWIAIWTNPPQ